MSYTPTADRGNWLTICDDCGKKYKASELRKRWDGLMVCTKTCYEERPMQDFVRAGVDHMATPWSRPENQDNFIQTCNPVTSCGIAYYAVAGCSKPNVKFPSWFGSVPAPTFNTPGFTDG